MLLGTHNQALLRINPSSLQWWARKWLCMCLFVLINVSHALFSTQTWK